MREKPQKEKEIRISLKARLTLIFICLFALLILGTWLTNRYFLPQYYQKKHIAQLKQARELLLKVGEDPDNEELNLQLTLLCESGGISCLLMEQGSGGNLILFQAGVDDKFIGRITRQQMIPEFMQISEVFEDAETYRIYKILDKTRDTEQLDCVGFQENGRSVWYYLLSVPMARIAETALIANRFLLFVGLGFLLLGSILIYLFSARLTEPIKNLTGLSRRMTALDFSSRYDGSSGDEIEVLGQNFNDLADKLEDTITDLTEAKHRLEQDVAEKEEQNQRRKELLSNISHELKTPIALIQGYAEGLRDGMCEDAETRERYSDIIIDEAGRMNHLVRQLLSLDELESGMAAVDATWFDLAELLRSVADSFSIRQESRGIDLEMELPEKAPFCSDAFMVEEIARNYMSNAFEYVEEGGTVRVSCRYLPEKMPLTVRLSVFNSGSSIPESAIPEIWNKFYKVDKARTRSYGGSGIGLSIVKAAADRLGGSCSAENKDGGVEFTAELPSLG